MLNWIVLYLTNMLLTTVKEAASPYTIVLANNNPSAVLPSLGLGACSTTTSMSVWPPLSI